MNVARHVVLIGMMGSGKSTLAPLLAAKLGLASYETDDAIAAVAGKSIPQVFADDGEQRFRELETEALSQALAGPPCVIAAGGGLPVQSSNSKMLADAGCISIYLQADPELLVDRLAGCADRPLLAGKEPKDRISELLSERAEAYKSIATHTISLNASDTPEDLCSRIAAQITDAS